jgi:ubiquitin carboxyl-terminal hydrolase 5/13
LSHKVLFTLDPFLEEYVNKGNEIFKKANFHDPLSDFKLQMAKVGYGLWSSRYSNPPPTDNGDEEVPPPEQGIRPAAFKATISKGHPEFSTNRQQDAHEFFMHLLNIMERAHVGSHNPATCFQFEVEDRIECGQSGKVL